MVRQKRKENSVYLFFKRCQDHVSYDLQGKGIEFKFYARIDLDANFNSIVYLTEIISF